MATVSTLTPCLLIVTGPVASGKTTLSQQLARDLHLPLLNRDRFKEIVFDRLGWSDRTWSERVGVTSYSLLYYCLEALLQTRCFIIIESNFQASYDSPKLQILCQRYDCLPIQLCCTIHHALLVERYVQRIENGQRHPGHADEANITALQQAPWSEIPEILDIAGKHLVVDTTSQSSLNYGNVLEFVQQYLNP